MLDNPHELRDFIAEVEGVSGCRWQGMQQAHVRRTQVAGAYRCMSALSTAPIYYVCGVAQ